MGQKITPQMKKEITKQWNEQFPSMGVLRTMDFGNILGPLFIGLTMRGHRIDDRYTPQLYIHLLCSEFICLTLCVSISDEEVVPSYRPYDDYLRIAKKLRNKAIIPLEGDIELELILNNLKEYYNYQEKYCAEVLDGKFQHYNAQDILEKLLYISGWSGVKTLIEDSVNFVEQKIKNFSPEIQRRKSTIEYIENAPIVSIAEWFETMKENIKDTEKLRNTVSEQIKFLKLTKLPVRKIIF